MLCLSHVTSEVVPELNYVRSSLANEKKTPRNLISYFLPLTFGSVFRKMHSTLDLFLLITLNIHFFLFCLFVSFYWLHHSACGSLVSWPRIKPVPPPLEMQSPKHRIHQGSLRIYVSDLNIISTLEQEKKLWTVGSDVKIAKDTMYKEKVSQKGCFFLFWSGTCWLIGSSVFVT